MVANLTPTPPPGTVVQLPALYPKQRAVFFTDARVSVCAASTKSGKVSGR
jgi:hypothetical protein